MPLMGFAKETMFPEGSIKLPLIVRDTLNQSIVLVNLLMIKSPSVYNTILGRPILNTLRAATSTYHLIIKFSIESGGVGLVSGDNTNQDIVMS